MIRKHFIKAVILLIFSMIIFSECKKGQPNNNEIKTGVSTVITAEVRNITNSTAICGGEVIADNGSVVTARGVCWSISENPTISDSCTTDGDGTGCFTSSLEGLNSKTMYYVRAYAVNEKGINYGNNKTFTTITLSDSTVTDADGNVYSTVTIGTQVWMTENLKTTKYKNGTNIPHVTGNSAWGSLSTPAYCWYNNDLIQSYGALYNWYAVNTGNLCPFGWHVPTDGEWTALEDYLIANSYNYDGTTTGDKTSKSLGSATGWTFSLITGAVGNTDYPEKRNCTGFTAVPGGIRYSYSGTFNNFGNHGYWWSSTENNANNAYYRNISYNYTDVYRNYYNKNYGFSIRCLRD